MLSEWAYKLASEDPNVIGWRASQMSDGGEWTPLAPEEVAGWLEEREFRDFDPGLLGDPRSLPKIEVALWDEGQLIGSTWALTVGPPNHPMVYLAGLAQRLSEWFAWLPADAAAFLLCDVIPDVRVADATLTRVSREVRWRSTTVDADAFSRVEAVIDPALSPEQVADWWRAIRDRLGLSIRKKQARSLPLADFAAEVGDGLANGEMLALWNEAHPDLAYDTEAHNFARYVRNAVEAELHLDLSAT